MKQQTEDVVYVEDNYTLMCNYLYDKFPNSIEQREFMQSTLESWENAKITRSILEDYQRTNEEKRKYFYDKFCSGEPKIHITIADRKQGKTMFTVGDMLFELRRRGWKIYTAFPFPELWINSSGELGSYFFFWNQPTKQKIKELKEKGVLVRYFNKPRIDGYVRISIGTDEQMDTLLSLVRSYLE